MMEMGERVLKTSGNDRTPITNDLNAFSKTTSTFLPETAEGRNIKKLTSNALKIDNMRTRHSSIEAGDAST